MVNRIRDFFAGMLGTALKHRFWFVAVAFLVLVVTINLSSRSSGGRQPPMDTGIVKINFETDANTSLPQSNAILARMEAAINKPGGTRRDQLDPRLRARGDLLRKRQKPPAGEITVHLVDRFHRKASIWQIEDDLRKEFRRSPV